MSVTCVARVAALLPRRGAALAQAGAAARDSPVAERHQPRLDVQPAAAKRNVVVDDAERKRK